jgi:hypothetical protein
MSYVERFDRDLKISHLQMENDVLKTKVSDLEAKLAAALKENARLLAALAGYSQPCSCEVLK